jgi:hypothetical protein
MPGFFQAIRQGAFVLVGQALDVGLADPVSLCPIGAALAGGKLGVDVLSREAQDIFFFPHLSPSSMKSALRRLRAQATPRPPSAHPSQGLIHLLQSGKRKRSGLMRLVRAEF